ncbi:hypothetical protein XENORESO_021305 [Xenotaenia resolanae]|uniref:Uncharacterized protein n=1 Tax=Xenotaenia resolanae TaxID=208358 RepID=A0ABV0WU64_9TELE
MKRETQVPDHGELVLGLPLPSRATVVEPHQCRERVEVLEPVEHSLLWTSVYTRATVVDREGKREDMDKQNEGQEKEEKTEEEDDNNQVEDAEDDQDDEIYEEVWVKEKVEEKGKDDHYNRNEDKDWDSEMYKEGDDEEDGHDQDDPGDAKEYQEEEEETETCSPLQPLVFRRENKAPWFRCLRYQPCVHYASISLLGSEEMKMTSTSSLMSV